MIHDYGIHVTLDVHRLVGVAGLPTMCLPNRAGSVATHLSIDAAGRAATCVGAGSVTIVSVGVVMVPLQVV